MVDQTTRSNSAAILHANELFQDYAADYVTIVGLETEEEEMVVIRNVDVLAKW